MAPAPIENMINAHPMVELTLVSGVGQVAAYAMVVLAEDLRPKVKDPAVKAKVDAELSQLLKEVNKQLADYEKLQMIVVAPEPWTVENGYLTPTMKIRRAWWCLGCRASAGSSTCAASRWATSPTRPRTRASTTWT